MGQLFLARLFSEDVYLWLRRDARVSIENFLNRGKSQSDLLLSKVENYF
jgi:hypothetical protein